MFLTKKHISRRTVLRGAGATLALPLLDAMVPAATLLAQTAASPKQRFVGCFVPHGAAPGYWVSTEGALAAELPFNWKALEPFRDRTVILSGLHSRSAEPPPGDRRRPLGRSRVPLRRQAEEDGRRGCLQRHHDRPDHRQEDRHRVADSVAATGRRRSRRQLEQLRRRLQLHLHQHDLVGVADLAAADGAESAGGVRAYVRRRSTAEERAARRKRDGSILDSLTGSLSRMRTE